MTSKKELSACVCAVAAALAMGACSPKYSREQADRQVYKIIADKTPRVPGMPSAFSVERPDEDPLEGLPPAGPATKINLSKALEIAAKNSREYQDRKEEVFLTALSLTLERSRFKPRLFGNVTGEFEHDGDEEESISAESAFGFTWLPVPLVDGMATTGSVADVG